MTVSSLKRQMIHAEDPAEKIRREVGPLDDITVLHNEVLVGVYLRPEAIDIGGGHKILLPDSNRQEDEYQGKVGLVLKMGPLAFVDDDHVTFAGLTAKVDDWVVFHTADGWSLAVRGRLCRMVKDTSIRLTVTAPDIVY